ncbi:uncharacterized protein LOC133332864 [Musca vetustissima]|uniref:uncharacterized protein LOC133332864 n=1 Tax=Musca vetustissima TaxID=27455 RepID=UPI002AB7CAC5|nr:uncharacterized protein LOC133332864 [Musca vetustissima]
MSNNVFAHTREAVRCKVKKCEPNRPPEWRKFSVDPQITSLEVLYSLLAKAFDIKSDFSIKYKAYDPAGNEIYLAVLSDWDLDAAFLRIHNISIQTSTEPCLMLQIDIKPFTEVKDWDPESTASASSALIGSGSVSSSTGVTPTGSSARELISPLQQSIGASQKYVQQMQTKLPGLIMNQMEKTFTMVQKAFNLNEETMAAMPPRPSLADNEFRMYLDALGQIQRTDELRKVIFLGGIDPSLRRVVWKHILNVYPAGMNGHQRMDYMRRKSEQYYQLRDVWKTAIKQGYVVGELAYVTSMVKKDVLRTDRLHPFYAGNDDNQNIASLFNILTTYALNHPSVSYCQGMSDIASPLLVTMNDEAQAYICFCAIMERVRGNFMLDGIAMTQKFAHLTEALSYYDSDFWEYLKSQQADDLLFCYRWLLLEMKREFPFEDALRMLEVQWSSLKYETSVDKELKLFEKEFVPITETILPSTPTSVGGAMPPISPSYFMAKPRENAYTKVCDLRRQSSSASLHSLSSSLTSSLNQGSGSFTSKLDCTRRLNQSLDDNMARHVATKRNRRKIPSNRQSLDETKMLQLLEGRHETPDALEVCSTATPDRQLDTDQSEDDDVFSDHSSHFTFHDTNPFKDDTSMKTENAPTPRSSGIHKAFLSSSSSSSLVGSDLTNNGTNNVSQDDGLTNETGDKKALPLPKGIAKLQNKKIISNYNTVSNIIVKQLTNASNTSGGHFKDLKEKIAATSRKGLSLEECNEKSQQRLVKNFNEFLNFASMNKSRVGNVDKTSTSVLSSDDNVAQKSRKTPSPQKLSPTPHPLVQLTKGGFTSSLEESDSSSIPDTTNNTWSCSTAATAIQQANNLSSNSLHLELNSLSSQTHTPERTPTMEATSQHKRQNARTPSHQEIRHDHANTTPEEGPDLDYPAIIRELHMEADNLDRQVFGDNTVTKDSTCSEIEYEKLGKDSLDMIEDLDVDHDSNALRSSVENHSEVRAMLIPNGGLDPNVNGNNKNRNNDSVTLNPFLEETANPGYSTKVEKGIKNSSSCEPFYSHASSSSSSLPEVLIPVSTTVPETGDVDEMATNAADEVAFSKTSSSMQQSIPSGNSTNSTPATRLPPPSEFGGGNPFLMFLCLTLLLQHRNVIMKAHMDYNEIAMHFDKMVRKHDVTRVLNQARRMYIDYLKSYAAHNQERQQHQHEQQSSVIANSAPQHLNDLSRNATTAIQSPPQKYHHSQTQRKFQQHSSNQAPTSSSSSFHTKS